jgi:hypothetical protein
MHLTLDNLLGVATIAFAVPFALGFLPRVPVVAPFDRDDPADRRVARGGPLDARRLGCQRRRQFR